MDYRDNPQHRVPHHIKWTSFAPPGWTNFAPPLTLKEQIIHGRIYRNIAELRNAVRGFVEQYNAQWIVEKNGYLSPAQARQAWHTAMSLRPAA